LDAQMHSGLRYAHWLRLLRDVGSDEQSTRG
jgi:hypothetical protein